MFGFFFPSCTYDEMPVRVETWLEGKPCFTRLETCGRFPSFAWNEVRVGSLASVGLNLTLNVSCVQAGGKVRHWARLVISASKVWQQGWGQSRGYR